jgi:hypothetical protein
LHKPEDLSHPLSLSPSLPEHRLHLSFVVVTQFFPCFVDHRFEIIVYILHGSFFTWDFLCSALWLFNLQVIFLWLSTELLLLQLLFKFQLDSNGFLSCFSNQSNLVLYSLLEFNFLVKFSLHNFFDNDRDLCENFIFIKVCINFAKD